MDRRCKAQLDFDYAKHGWAFCNKPMLEAKLEHLKELAKFLNPKDRRHAELRSIQRLLDKKDD